MPLGSNLVLCVLQPLAEQLVDSDCGQTLSCMWPPMAWAYMSQPQVELTSTHTASNPDPPTPPSSHPAPLATSQLPWAQQWITQADPRHPATILKRANCKTDALWLQQWQSFANSPPNINLVKAAPKDEHSEAS